VTQTQKHYKEIESQLNNLAEVSLLLCFCCLPPLFTQQSDSSPIFLLYKMEESFKKDVLYFGERSADDLSSFFSDWDKFTQAFQVMFCLPA